MASKRNTRRKLQRVCQRKIAFDTERAAWDVIADMRSRNKFAFTSNPDATPQAYHCPLGDHWHVGRLPAIARHRIYGDLPRKHD